MNDKNKIRLLIILNYYPPDLTAAARRWGNLISELQNEGFDCTVICAGNGDNFEYTGTSGERVVRLPISNTNNPEDSKVGFKTPKSKLKKIVKNIFYQLWPPIFRSFSFRSWLRQSSTIIDYAGRANYIISSYGPAGPFFLGFWLSKRVSKPWVVDIRDSFESRDGSISVFSRNISRLIEKYLLRQAHIRITVSKTLADYLTNAYQIPFSAIYNGWTDEDKTKLIPSTSEFAPYIFYGGSIYEHRLPALKMIIQALKYYPKLGLKIRLLNDYTNGSLNLMLSQESTKSQIEILPAAPYETIEFEMSQSLCVLVLEDISDSSPLRNGTITGKLLGLLVSGFPGIAISSRSGEIRNLVEKVNGWFGVETIEQCVNAISVLKEQNELITMTDSLEQYSTKAQARLLANLLT